MKLLKGGIAMTTKKPNRVPNSLARTIFSNILRSQFLLGVTDAQLADLLGVTTRTLCNYKADPSAMTLRQLQAVAESFGIDPDALLKQ